MSSRPSTCAPPRVASSSASRADSAATPNPDALQQQRLARLGEHVRRVVRCRAVDAQADVHAGVEHRAHRRDSRSQPHVRRRAMRDAGAGPGEEIDAVRIELHAVRVPDVGTGEAQLFRIIGGRAAEAFARKGDVVVVFGEMRVQAHAVGSRKRRRLAHQVAGNRERRARRRGHAQHRKAARVVERFDHPARVARGWRPRPRRARREAGRRPIRPRSSRRGRRGSAGRSRAPLQSCRRGGRRWETGTGDRWRSCSR